MHTVGADFWQRLCQFEKCFFFLVMVECNKRHVWKHVLRWSCVCVCLFVWMFFVVPVIGIYFLSSTLPKSLWHDLNIDLNHFQKNTLVNLMDSLLRGVECNVVLSFVVLASIESLRHLHHCTDCLAKGGNVCSSHIFKCNLAFELSKVKLWSNYNVFPLGSST